MKLIIDDEFREICREIVAAYEREGESSLVWSDDQYQAAKFCGGWDPKHARFAFSFYASDGGDYIFSFTLEDARVVAAGGEIDPMMEWWKDAPNW